ncbi:phosducin-like protein 2 [Acrodontium crateriforme]|uniref:Phosducin-like protein 2 n=1 Tax=Acrodontium crateriforme TaxID=150365 RepID=A0AAQ3M437_9PEZI|nr:phosducin-like protein 2 [Acrodontium crateriforme]
MDMNMPINVPVDDPNADTEWNDILRKHGVIPERPPSPTPMIEEALTEARRLAHENRLEGKDLDELDELEDDEDEEFLDQYRQKRMNELATLQQASVYNQVYPVSKPDYAREVTEASQKSFVFVLLTSSSGTNFESQLMTELWRELAKKFGEIKFCQMQANLCIDGYPDRNTPTILVYKDSQIKRQIVTLKELNGNATKMEDVEKVLLSLEVIKHADSRLKNKDDNLEGPGKSTGIRPSKLPNVDDDDSDWD